MSGKIIFTISILTLYFIGAGSGSVVTNSNNGILIRDSVAGLQVDSLLTLSNKQAISHPDKAFKYASMALELMQEKNLKDSSRLSAYYQMGRALFFMGLNDSSLIYFNKVLHEQKVNYSMKGKVYNTLCMVYRKWGKYQTSLYYADSALKLYQQKSDSANIYFTLFNKAKVYWIAGKQKNATDLLFTTLKYAEKSGNKTMQVNILGTIADGYMDLGKINKAKEFYLKAIDRYNTGIADYVIANILNNYGTLFYEEKDYDSALICYNRALNVYKQTGQADGVAIASQNLGITYVFLGQPDKGLFYLKSALNTFTSLQMKNSMASALVDLGTAFMEFKQYDSAAACFHKVLDITSQIKSAYYKKLALKYLYELNQQKGDYKKAFEYYQQYVAFKDSIDNLSMQRNLQELAVKYKTAEHEKEIIHLKDQELIERANNRFLTGTIISLMLILLLLLFGVWFKRKKDLQLHKQKLLVSEKEKILIKEKLAKQQAIKTRLETEVEYKTRQLASHALNMMQKNRLLQSLTESIDKMIRGADKNTVHNLKEVKQQLHSGLNIDKDWDLFKLYFEQVNDAFFDKLKAINPNLTSNDYKLCALIKLNMNIKEMAAALNISPDSLKNARYRLKRKLKLDNTQKLNNFIINL